MRSHEAGALHAEGYGGPPLAAPPADVMELLPQLWPRTVGRDDDGRLTVGGVDVLDPRARARHRRPTSWTKTTSVLARGVPRRLRAAFEPPGAAPTSTTRARRSSAPPSPAGSPRRACTSTSAPAASSPWRSGPASPRQRIGLHGNNKTTAEIREALSYGVGRIVVDSFDEIDRIAAVAAELGVVAPGDGAGDRRRRGAHPRVHRHRPRGPEVRLQPRRRPGARGGRRGCWPGPTCSTCAACTATSAARSSTPPASRWRPAGSSACTPQIADEHGLHCPRSTSAAATASPTPPQHTPLTAGDPGAGDGRHRRARAQGRRRRRHTRVPRISIEPGRAIVGPSTFTLYEVGTVKDVELDGGAIRTYVSVDGGMSDNARPALYEADYSCTLASRRSTRRAAGCRAWSASTARAATSSSRTSTCPPTSRPAT